MILERAKKLAATYMACRHGDLSGLKILHPNLDVNKRRLPRKHVVWDREGSPVVRKNGKVVNRYSHPQPLNLPTLDRVDKLWLEYRYGWSPLVKDIVDQLKAINAQLLRDDLTQRDYTRVSGKWLGEKSSPSTTGVVKDGGSWTMETAYTHKVEARAYAKYRVSLKSGVLNRLNDFGAFDVPRALWEIVPYSFVVDWFVPIGDWLGAITPRVGVEMLEGGSVVRHSKEQRRTLTGYVSTSSGVGSWPNAPFPLGASDFARAWGVTRQPGLSFPFYPPLDPNLGLKRLVDAAALLTAARPTNRNSNLRI